MQACLKIVPIGWATSHGGSLLSWVWRAPCLLLGEDALWAAGWPFGLGFPGSPWSCGLLSRAIVAHTCVLVSAGVAGPSFPGSRFCPGFGLLEPRGLDCRVLLKLLVSCKLQPGEVTMCEFMLRDNLGWNRSVK